MSTTDEKIISELSKQSNVVKYSTFREKFTDQNFFDRLTFLITTGDVLVAGWNEEKSKYPEEAVKINRVFQQYHGEKGGVPVDNGEELTQYVKDLLSGRESQSSALKKMNMENDPFLISRTNWQKYLKETEKSKT